MIQRFSITFLMILLLGLAACNTTATPIGQVDPPAATSTSPPTSLPSATPSPTRPPTLTPTSTPTPSPTSTPTPTPTSTHTPTLTPTPDPYAELTINYLANRSYGGGEVTIEDTLAKNAAFTRYLITYPSEGLTLYAFMNVPQGEGPFPVALVMHGYVSPAQYNTIAYTTRYADALARAGYLVIHPNYRNWPPSDEGADPFRAVHAADALNLISIIRAQAGQPGSLEKADPDFVGMMGHSMGGGVTLRTITVANAVQAAVLYGAMSGDERLNYEKIREWSGGAGGRLELNAPDADLERIGPIYHLERITTPISIHHGDNDGTVPLDWSLDLCNRLTALGKTVECFTYPGQPHTFRDEGDQLFMQRMIDFFNTQAEKSLTPQTEK